MRYLGLGMPIFTSFIGSALFEIAAFANRKEREAAVYQSEKLEAEIKFLKSQINPHFLFNALNNIYTLTLLKSDNAPDHLLKLSGMLRYMLHDCKAEKVPLHKEIAYLQNFIDLQMLKDSSGLNVKVHFDESRPNLNMAPMLLILFVENAFKHSKFEDLANGWITIGLRTGEHHIEFEVENSPAGNRCSKRLYTCKSRSQDPPAFTRRDYLHPEYAGICGFLYAQRTHFVARLPEKPRRRITSRPVYTHPQILYRCIEQGKITGGKYVAHRRRGAARWGELQGRGATKGI